MDKENNSPNKGTDSPASTSSPSTASGASSTPTSSSTPSGGHNVRKEVYLLERYVEMEKLSKKKLPKNREVLARFLFYLENNVTKEGATKKVTEEILEVWQFHFGNRLVYGMDNIGAGEKEDESVKIVVRKNVIADKVNKLYKTWYELERLSRREDRNKKESFLEKEKAMKQSLKDPMNISKVLLAEEILRFDSGIMDWQEDYQHLQNQLQRDQVGSVVGFDNKQKKKDNAKEKMTEDEKRKVVTEEKNKKARFATVNTMEMDDASTDMNANDKDFNAPKSKKRKADIAGAIASTGDRLNISCRQRTMIASSVVKAVGVSVHDTNISRTTVWRKSRENRITSADKIKQDFVKPKYLTVHWDGKIMKLRKGVTSDRCCVYVAAAGPDKVQKLLGVPDLPRGTGAAQKKAVTELLESWNISKEVSGLVFDTTSSNSGIDNGACVLIEQYLQRAILWLGCRHHIYELNIKHVAGAVLGDTKEPGVKLFKKLRDAWNSLDIDYQNLNKFPWSTADPWMCDKALEVLDWAQYNQEKGTWPRDDYRELLELLIVWLGGDVEGFSFKRPGADHHARWLAKAIYELKLCLLMDQFIMEEKQKGEVLIMAQFVGLFYAKAFLQSPLPCSAPSNDLAFMSEMIVWKKYQPRAAFLCLQSCYRHLWYLTPQMVVLSLLDKDLANIDKEEMAMKLFSLERDEKIQTGKPTFPSIAWSVEGSAPKLSSFITKKSWLIFDILDLKDPQEWMQTPASLWDKFSDYRKFRDFGLNLSVVNDIAERGIKLVSDFIERCRDEGQRQALLQVVEEHRNKFPSYNKATLAKL